MGTEITTREKEILRCLAHGLENKEIAAELRVKIRTVTSHLEKLSDKFDVHGRVNILRYALWKGILTIGDFIDEISE